LPCNSCQELAYTEYMSSLPRMPHTQSTCPHGCDLANHLYTVMQGPESRECQVQGRVRLEAAVVVLLLLLLRSLNQYQEGLVWPLLLVVEERVRWERRAVRAVVQKSSLRGRTSYATLRCRILWRDGLGRYSRVCLCSYVYVCECL
jgi:hypothetical protein